MGWKDGWFVGCSVRGVLGYFLVGLEGGSECVWVGMEDGAVDGRLEWTYKNTTIICNINTI